VGGGALTLDRVGELRAGSPAFRVWLLSSVIRSRPLRLLRLDSGGSCRITSPPGTPPIRALLRCSECSAAFPRAFARSALLDRELEIAIACLPERLPLNVPALRFAIGRAALAVKQASLLADLRSPKDCSGCRTQALSAMRYSH
jgi:hypothetical protein